MKIVRSPFTKKLAPAVFAILCFLGAGCASADVVTITSSGTWGDGTPNDISAPGAPWTLTLTVNSPLSNDPGGIEFDATVINGSYQFGTTATSFTPSLVRFYTSDVGGGFTVALEDTDSGLGVSNSQQFFDGNTLALIPGTYQSQQFTALANNGNAYSTADIVVGGAVPEPSTWSLLALGVVGTSVLTLRRRRTLA